MTQTDLAAITALINQRLFPEARTRATELIDRSAKMFDSPREERFLKAKALGMRGEAAARAGDDAAALDDYKQAASLGDPQAAYQVAARFTIAARDQTDVRLRIPLRDQAQDYYEMCAELGDADCTVILQRILRAEGRKADENYWFLLARMNDPPDEQRKFLQLYTEKFKDEDKQFLSQVLRERSLSSGESAAQFGLPGRSVLTAAFVDMTMRRQLAFVWRAFFSPDAPDSNLLQSFENFRQHLPVNPFATAYLLIRLSAPGKRLDVVSVPDRQRLASSMLPGDSIVIRCGALTHEAVVWSVDRPNGKVLILDPFYEFWQPSHNSCVQSFKLTPYKPGRDLVKLSLAEIEQILEAVIAIRDLQVPNSAPGSNPAK